MTEETPIESMPEALSEQNVADSEQVDWKSVSDHYEALRSVARLQLLNHQDEFSLGATALLHEAFLELAGDDRFHGHPDPRLMMAAAVTKMRDILIRRSRERKTLKRGGGKTRLMIDDVLDRMKSQKIDLTALYESIRRLEATWPRQAECVKMSYFLGMTIAEIAGVQNVSVATVERDLRLARGWLMRDLRREGYDEQDLLTA
jgi:RNA polymerase sigma factor (TIGR02999 family)